MLKKLMQVAVAVLFTSASGLFAAESHGSKQEAIAMAEMAAAQYQSEGFDATAAAIMDMENATYHDRDLYAFIVDHEGVMRAHGTNPKLVDRNLLGLKDPSGRTFIVEMVELSQSGASGWVSYNWTNPTTNKVDAKASYVLPLGDDLFVGVGVYDQ